LRPAALVGFGPLSTGFGMPPGTGCTSHPNGVPAPTAKPGGQLRSATNYHKKICVANCCLGSIVGKAGMRRKLAGRRAVGAERPPRTAAARFFPTALDSTAGKGNCRQIVVRFARRGNVSEQEQKLAKTLCRRRRVGVENLVVPIHLFGAPSLRCERANVGGWPSQAVHLKNDGLRRPSTSYRKRSGVARIAVLAEQRALPIIQMR